jgi:hypothetical protein
MLPESVARKVTLPEGWRDLDPKSTRILITEGVATVLLSDWRVLTRRWYVVLGGLLITMLLCLGAASASPAQYEASSSFMLLPPEALVNGKPTNPYLNLGGLDGMADVVSTAMTDNSVADAMTKTGVTADYEIKRDFTIAGPVLNLDVRGSSPVDALSAQAFLLKRVPVVLNSLQSAVSVAVDNQISSTVITQDKAPKVNRKKQIRLLLVAGIGGLGVTYLGATVVDGILLGRRKPPVGAARPLAPPLPAPPSTASAGGRSWRP